MAKVVISSSGIRQEITAGKHQFISDGGEDIGGANEGPNPHELMLAALGSCTSMTLRVFAKRREWPLESVKVELTEEAVEDPSTPGKKMSRIERKIEVSGALTEEQVNTLKDIADKCPIHKLLVGNKEVKTAISAAVAGGR